MQHLIHVLQRGRRLRAPALGLEVEDLANQPQRVQPAFLRRDEKFHLIGKKNQADLVAVANRAEGKQTRHLRRQFALAQVDAAEISGGTDVDHEHDGQFPLLGEFFHVSIAVDFAELGRHIPIDRPHLVARLVLAHFLEIHAASLEDAPILSGKRRRHEAARLQFETADLFENGVSGFHVTSLTSDQLKPTKCANHD